MKVKFIYFFLFFSLIISCRDNEAGFVYIDVQQISSLNASDIFFSFDDKYPVSLTVKDSLAYIIHIKSNTCIIVLDLKTNRVISNLGNIGYGPGDIIRPEFMHSTDNHPNILLEDVSSKKFMKIDIEEKMNFILKKFIDYPDKIFPSGETNISKNFIAGRRIQKGKMFYIYDRNTDLMTEIDYYPVVKELKHDPNYIFASVIALNEERNRIITGMYFFDMFHVYDLKGKRIKASCFSRNCIPAFDSNDLMRDIQKCKAGIIRTFPTKDYCYFLRITGDRLIGETENMLIQINWEGELIKAYTIPDHIEGQFYIDEQEEKMYAIRRVIKSYDEFYEVVSYLLDR